MKPSTVFIDLDGTLLSSRKMISFLDYITLTCFIKSGGNVFIATGRSPIAARNIAKRLNLSSEFVSYNGACVHLGNNQYKIFPLSQNEISLVLAVADKYSFELIFYTKDLVLVKEINSINAFMLSDTIAMQKFETVQEPPDHLNIVELQQFDIIDYRSEILKIALIPKNVEILYNVYEELKRFSLNTVCTSSHIEITSKLSNKFKGAEYILDKYSIDVANCMAIGDGENDMALLTSVGIGVSMSNASDIVKKNAKYITGTNDGGGVSEAIKRYAMKYYDET